MVTKLLLINFKKIRRSWLPWLCIEVLAASATHGLSKGKFFSHYLSERGNVYQVCKTRKGPFLLIFLSTAFILISIFSMCLISQLAKFTKMNVWMYVLYWVNKYPTGPDDPICMSQAKKRNQTNVFT